MRICVRVFICVLPYELCDGSFLQAELPSSSSCLVARHDLRFFNASKCLGSSFSAKHEVEHRRCCRCPRCCRHCYSLSWHVLSPLLVPTFVLFLKLFTRVSYISDVHNALVPSSRLPNIFLNIFASQPNERMKRIKLKFVKNNLNCNLKILKILCSVS